MSGFGSAKALVLLYGLAALFVATDDAAATPDHASTPASPRASKATTPDTAERRIRVAQLAPASRDHTVLALPQGKEGLLPLPPLAREGTQYSFLRIRGLPQGFKLTAGFATKDAWLVSLNDAAKLSIVPEPSFQGEVYLEVLLVRGTETARLNVIKVSFGNASQTKTAATLEAPPPPITASVTPAPMAPTVTPAPEPAAPPKRTITPEAEESGLKRADRLLTSSDIAAARMVYETMVVKGSAKAALFLGQTFDPNFLALFPLQGLKPDPAQAKKWYQRAIELGEVRARERLSDLGE